MSEKIRNQRSIIDRKALTLRLEEVAAEGLSKAKRRTAVLAIFKEAYQASHAEVRRRFEISGIGTEAVHEQSFLIDQLVRLAHDFAASHEFPASTEKAAADILMSVVAVGGYGRGELSPHSDIDLLFLLPAKRNTRAEHVVQYMLYLLWDIGLKVGHSTRTVDECMRQAKGDMTIRTALLEARWVWGDQDLAEEMKRRFRAEIVSGTGEAFVEAKLAERAERHSRLGEARYVLEPNLKDGKGGLRDLHTLYWIAKYLYVINEVDELVTLGVLSQDAANRFGKAQTFLWTVRSHLHYLTSRMEDRLTFDRQPEIAARMGYTDHGGTTGVERFMKHYFLIAKDVGDLTRIFCALLEEQHKRKPKLRWPAILRLKKVEGFVQESGRLDIENEEDLTADPVKMIRLFATALDTDLDIHPHALSLITQNLRRIDNKVRHDPEANRLFMEMLTSRKDPEKALRHMNEAGVLGRFIPDFGRVVAQMQFDMYHVYTVDEHTVQAVGILHRLEQGQMKEAAPIASAEIHAIQSRRALYLAVFLHDIAKGRGGDHSELGAEVAMKLGPRLGLTDEETETTAWLVRWHLLMSNTAFKRDIEDPATIGKFVAEVQSPERLRLLLALTVADIRAVGPNVWTGWKAGLLRELYRRALDVMSGGIGVERREARVEAAQDELRRRLETEGWEAADIEAHLARGYPSYWVSFDTDTHLNHARLVHQAEQDQKPLTLDWRRDETRSVTEVTLYTADHPGLFARIAGAMALSGVSIVDAKIITMTNGMALDSFQIEDSAADEEDRTNRRVKLVATIEQALSGKLRLDRELAKRRDSSKSRTKLFPVPPRVLIHDNASAAHTVIEINGRDRVGLLYDLTSTMTKLNLQIASAHISTYGERVVDVFYVKDVFGLKIENDRKKREIKNALALALTEKADSPSESKRGAAE